jgi:hypothetical protein
LSSLLLVGACGRAERAPEPARAPAAVEVRAGARLIARVVPGAPCRAVVEGLELLVGLDPVVARHGEATWRAVRAADGTTLLRDGQPRARLHAGQLFDEAGRPLLGVRGDGAIWSRGAATRRRAVATPAGAPDPAAPGTVRVGDVTATGTTDLLAAALLAAPEVTPELRAITACYLLSTEGAP